MHDTSKETLLHARRALRERIEPAVAAREVSVAAVAWQAPGEPLPFPEAIAAAAFAPIAVGAPWGPPWSTMWLRFDVAVPEDWPGGPLELDVDLGFNRANPGFQAEGLAFDPEGAVIKAIEPRNSAIPLRDAAPGAAVRVYVEAAANPDIAGDWSATPTDLGSPASAGHEPQYVYRGARLVLRDETVAALERDWSVLLDLVDVLPDQSVRRSRIQEALARASDALDPDDVRGSARAARGELAAVLAAPAAASSHAVTAVGHAHIDSAWLWPVRETVRKVARTFSNGLDLMDVYPDFVFAASSAQQYAWIRDRYPALFARVAARVAEGRFIPVGRMWVESDTNMPGGEAMARQLVLGTRFFEEHFGTASTTVWLPDSFGYSAALPQLMLAAGARAFLTQKPSWNDTNTLPHRSFLWQGIDGSRILTHLPPVDSYNSDLGAADLARAERQHTEAGVSDRSLVPFGWGDGGGGPTREQIEAGLRKRDLEGSPRVELGAPDPFFERVREELPEPAVWSGEMYLEYHRGTYTSQARTKEHNRKAEGLLREAELWAATAAVRAGVPYPQERLRSAWESVLLGQFHDILPGSSIRWVHEEHEERIAGVRAELERVVAESLRALAGEGAPPAVASAAPLPVQGGSPLGVAAPLEADPAVVRPDGDGWVLEGAGVAAAIDAEGHLVHLRARGSERELIPAGARGNEVQLFRDLPNEWDAWDIDRGYQRLRLDAVTTTSVARDGDAVVVRRTVGRSTLAQRITVAPSGDAIDVETTVDWRETRKLLKLAFPFDVAAERALSEIQFGHVARPIHTNTSWDAARFETVAHRWLRVEDGRDGVTLANDRTYGHDVTRAVGRDGAVTVLVRETLLRSARFPDPRQDHGVHVFRHRIVPGTLLTGIAEAYALQSPPRTAAGRVEPLVRVDPASGVVVETVKLAEDGSGDVVVRLYEALGGRARTRLEPGFPAGPAVRTDLLEVPLPEQPADPLELRLRAFELVTLRLPVAARRRSAG
ncbi:alpha-mannosidase [Amnibacterium sp.]|uniref:alpha-mannosidase n=1 Tax=Amnibacterium sp. TaxID=1872496 RepID=UPI003F7BFEC8